jgi:hypothetical protein
MRLHEASPDADLAALLARFEKSGGRLDYVHLQLGGATSAEACHKAAALAGIAAIDRRLESWAISHASQEHPVERFFRLTWNESKLVGGRVSFATFWGTDDVIPKPLGRRAWSCPDADGYKPAFFHPPYGLRGTDQEKGDLFNSINAIVLGTEPTACEIFSWSTDWSNYFDAGKEWWGAFYWTVRPAGSDSIVVIGASSTD